MKFFFLIWPGCCMFLVMVSIIIAWFIAYNNNIVFAIIEDELVKDFGRNFSIGLVFAVVGLEVSEHLIFIFSEIVMVLEPHFKLFQPVMVICLFYLNTLKIFAVKLFFLYIVFTHLNLNLLQNSHHSSDRAVNLDLFRQLVS